MKQLALLIALLCWLFGTKGLRYPGWLLSLQLFVALVVEAWARSLAIHYESNLWLYNATSPVEFTTQLLFGVAMVRNRPVFYLAMGAMCLYGCIFVGEFMFRGNGETLFTRSALTSAFLLTVLFTYLLFKFAMREDVVLYKDPHFWLFLGIVAYYGGMIPMLGLLNALSAKDVELASRLYVINDVLYYLNLATLVLAGIMFRIQKLSHA